MISRRFIRFATVSGLFVAAMGASGAARAQVPVITGVSGAVQPGASLTISGTGFGVKPVAAPLKWDSFESGTNGAVVGNGWATTTGCSPSPCKPPIYTTGVTRPNSTKSVRANFEDNGRTDCPDPEGCSWSSSFGLTNVPLPKIYLDAWVYYAPANPSSRNVKLLRVHTNTYAPNLYFNIYCVESPDGARLGQDGGGTGIYVPDAPWRGSSFFAGNWRHIQMYLAESSPSVGDGSAVLTIDNATSINRLGSNFVTRTASTQFWNTIWMGNYVGHGVGSPCYASPGNTYTYWDDAYVDTTRAHVEIGNAATYSLCNHREIQIPTAWSSNSITITANRGSFASLGNSYLYVVDRNGAVNTVGYQLASTGGGDVIPPDATRDLRSRVGP
jgi:hypothetical protein